MMKVIITVDIILIINSLIITALKVINLFYQKSKEQSKQKQSSRPSNFLLGDCTYDTRLIK